MKTRIPEKFNSVREDEINIDTASVDDKLLLAQKNNSIWQQAWLYWKPIVEEGRENWDALAGISLSDEEKRRYEDEDKFPIELPLIFPKIKDLSGHQRSIRKDGVPVPIGAEDAPDTEQMNIILKAIRQQNDLDQLESDAFMKMLVTGMNQYTFVDKPDFGEDRNIAVTLDDWDAWLEDPGADKRTGRGAEYHIGAKIMSPYEAMQVYPDKAEEIDKLQGSTMYDDKSFDILDEPNLTYDAHQSQSYSEERGYLTIVERYFFIEKVVTAFVHDMDPDPKVLPVEWSPERIMDWMKDNPGYEPIRIPQKILWVTASTGEGVLLENRPHWYQEQAWPFAICRAPVVNKVPFAWMKLMKQAQKMKAIGMTEWTSSVRNSLDNLMVAHEGALVDTERAEKEKRRGGVVLVNDEYNIQSSLQFPVNTAANGNYEKMMMFAEGEMQIQSGLPAGFSGASESANESANRLSMRLGRAEASQGMWFDSFQVYDRDLHKLILNSMPYIIDKYTVIRYIDEYEEQKAVEINKPDQYNPMTYQPKSWINNLDGAKYDYLIGSGDNSISGRQEEANLFVTILSQVLPKVPQDMWGTVLKYFPSALTTKFGQKIMEQEAQRQQDIAQGNVPSEADVKVLMNLKGEDIQTNNPVLFDILKRAKVINPTTEPTGQEVSQGVVKENLDAMNAIGTKQDPNVMGEAALTDG